MGPGFAARAPGLFGLPVNRQVGEIKAAPLLGWPPRVPRGRSEQIYAIVLPTLDEPLGCAIALVHQRGAWQECCLGQGRVHRWPRIVIASGSRGRMPVGEEVREGIVTGRRQGHCVGGSGVLLFSR